MPSPPPPPQCVGDWKQSSGDITCAGGSFYFSDPELSVRTFTKSEEECCDLVSNTWGASDFDEENPVVLWQWTHSEDVTRTCDPAAGCLGAIARKTEYLNVYWNHDLQAWITDPDYKERQNSKNNKENKKAAMGFEIQDFNTPKKALKACQRIYGDEVTAISDVEFPADQMLPLGSDGFKSEWPCDADKKGRCRNDLGKDLPRGAGFCKAKDGLKSCGFGQGSFKPNAYFCVTKQFAQPLGPPIEKGGVCTYHREKFMQQPSAYGKSTLAFAKAECQGAAKQQKTHYHEAKFSCGGFKTAVGDLMEAPGLVAKHGNKCKKGDVLTKKGLEEGTTCDPKKARIEPSMATPRECCAKCTGEPECIAWQMKRSTEDHYEKAKCVLVFTDLWLSPEVTAFDVAGWATSIPSWGVIHYREVEAKPPPPPPPVPRADELVSCEHIKTPCEDWMGFEPAPGTIACWDNGECMPRFGNEEWCYNAAEWKQCVTKDWMWCRCKGEQCALDKVDPSHESCEAYCKEEWGGEECEPPLADGIWTYVPDWRIDGSSTFQLTPDTEPPATLYNCAAKCLDTPNCLGFDYETGSTKFKRCFGKFLRSTDENANGDNGGGNWDHYDLAAPPPPPASPPPAPPPPPTPPKTCWAWGDPHYIGFDGGEYDFHGLGVHTMASWQGPDGRTGHVQTYHCPVICGDDIGSTDWFPCGASSAVAMLATAPDGHTILVAGDMVYVDGEQLATPLASGEYREFVPGILKGARLIDNDPDFKTPGMKLRLKTGDDVEISTWKWVTAHMPTGYLQNVRLQLPPHLEPTGGVCTRKPVTFEYWNVGANCGRLDETIYTTKLPKETFELSEMAFDGGGVGTYNGSNKAVNNPIIAGYQTGGNWAARLTSELTIADAGEYKLYLRLGDADTAKLYINGELVISTGCDWGRSKVHTVKKVLEAGHHKVAVHYADDGWADRLRVTYSGPDTLGKEVVVGAVVDNSFGIATKQAEPWSAQYNSVLSDLRAICQEERASKDYTPLATAESACARTGTDYTEANEACGERFGAMIDLKQFERCKFDYCVLSSEELIGAQEDVYWQGDASLEPLTCPAWNRIETRGLPLARLLIGDSSYSVSDTSLTMVFPAVHTIGGCCKLAKQYACSDNPVWAFQLDGGRCVLQRKKFFDQPGMVLKSHVEAIAGDAQLSALLPAVRAGPKPDDFDPKSPLTSYIDHRACGPRGDDAKADTSACPDGRAMVIKKQRWGSAQEVVHTDVDGCEYFAYTIYECELKAEIRPADASGSGSGSGSGSASGSGSGSACRAPSSSP